MDKLAYRDLPPPLVTLPTQLGLHIFPQAFLTRFSWSPLHQISIQKMGEEHSQVQVGKKQIELRGISADFVETLFNQTEFSLLDMADWAPELDFDREIAPLMTRLVTEGILQVKTD